MISTCKNCVHYLICESIGMSWYENFDDEMKNKTCTAFINRANIAKVRCGECKFNHNGLCWNHVIGHENVDENDFCNYGIPRKE